MINLILSVLLVGQISNSKELGVIGIRHDWDGVVIKVREHTPASEAGIQLKDKIISVDGNRGKLTYIDGQAGTPVYLEIKRGKEVFTIKLIRRDLREMPDLPGYYFWPKNR